MTIKLTVNINNYVVNMVLIKTKNIRPTDHGQALFSNFQALIDWLICMFINALKYQTL